MIKRSFFITVGIFVFVVFSYAQEQFPYLGEIVADNVNVRAGPNINFERLSQLGKGREVVVVEKSYGWCKIELPEGSNCYIHRNYIQPRWSNVGIVTANRVNLRAGPGEKFSILGWVHADTKIKIIEQQGDWYKIEPVEESYGWITEEFIVFRSQEIPPSKVVELPSRNLYRKPKPHQETPPTEPSQEPELFSVVGRVEDIGRILLPTRHIRYRLRVDDNTMYYLEGPKDLIDSFVYYKVKVQGNLNSDFRNIGAPIISVVKIQIVP